MRQIEIVIGLLAGVAVLAAIAGKAGLPYAAVLVLGGLVLGLIPGVPDVALSPQLVLLGFLPPLVFSAAFQAASYDLRPHAGQILALATGLVVATVAAVAVAGRALAALPWTSALVLGALAAPTDPVSATSVMRHVGAPERIVAVLEGESLINDGTGLAMFQVAVAAAAGGISIGSGVERFLVISAGGSAIGLAAGWLLVHLRRRFDEPSLQIVLGLLAAFGSYVAAYAIGWSGVLAAVTAGLYAGSQAEAISSPGTRLNTEPFWSALTFLFESVLFLLIGLQLPHIVDGLHHTHVTTDVAYGAALVGVVAAVRAAWMAMLRVAPVRQRRSGRELTVLGFSGMRGALSLAGALSIPLVVGHHAFAARDEVIFLVYMIVLGTLVVPSLTLEPLVRRLGLARPAELRRLDIAARTRILHAGLARLEELAPEAGLPDETVDRLRGTLELRLQRLEALGADEGEEDPGGGTGAGAGGDGRRAADVATAVRRLRAEIIAAERAALAQLRSERRAPGQVLADIQRDIDLDEIRLQ